MKKIIMVVLNNVVHDPRVIKEAESLVNAGYKVSIIGIKLDRNENKDLKIHGLSVHLINLYTKEVFPKNYFGWLLKYIEFCLWINIKLIFIPYHIIHAHNLDALLSVYLQSKLRGKRIIYDSHELFTEMAGKKSNLVNQIWLKIDKFMLNNVDLVFTANESRSIIMYKEYGSKKKPISLMNIPTEFLDISKKDLSKPLEFIQNIKKNIVIYQGAINQFRDTEKLIAASEYFDKGLILVLIGSFATKKYETKIRNWINKKFTDKVIILNPVPQKELFRITLCAHIGVVIYDRSTRNNYYCAPNKLYEYASAGIPAAGSDLPEIRNVIKQYHIGELFSENTPKQIALSINKINQDYQFYSGKEKFRKLFSEHNWKIEEKKLIGYYSSL